jgi:hypothetical protein
MVFGAMLNRGPRRGAVGIGPTIFTWKKIFSLDITIGRPAPNNIHNAQ